MEQEQVLLQLLLKVAKDMGILTVGIVTVPFGFEGKKRKLQAENGLDTLKRVCRYFTCY